MTFPSPSLPAIHVVRAIRSAGPFPDFGAGDGVRFHVPAGEVRATIIGVDRKARAEMPLGLPWRLTVREAPPGCGYAAGLEYTIRAGCLESDGSTPVRAAAVPPGAATMPLFLVAFLREGGSVPVQGAVLVRGATLESASAAAMAMLTAELEADVRERGESPEAMVMLLNASEVPSAADAAGDVIATVSW